jgi:hypothetical protein
MPDADEKEVAYQLTFPGITAGKTNETFNLFIK